MSDTDKDEGLEKDSATWSMRAVGLTKGTVTLLVLIAIAVGGYHGRFYIRYAMRHIVPVLMTNYKMALYILVASILTFVVIWYLANYGQRVDGEDGDSVPSSKTPAKGEKGSVKKFLQEKWEKVSSERKALAGWFLGLFLLLHLVLAIFFWTPYKFLWSHPTFLPTQIIVIGLLAILALFDEHKVLKAMAIAIVAIAVTGYSRNLYLKLDHPEENKKISTEYVSSGKGRVVPLPVHLPPDTQFVMVVNKPSDRKKIRSDRIKLPVYYNFEFTPLPSETGDHPNCYNVYTQLGGPFPICKGQKTWTALNDDVEEVQVESRLPQTRFKVRVYDTRVASSQRVF